MLEKLFKYENRLTYLKYIMTCLPIKVGPILTAIDWYIFIW